LPDIPTVSEYVPGYEGNAWFGVGAPKNTSANKEINAGLADPSLRVRFAVTGGVPMLLTPSEFGTFIAGETEKWGKVIRAALDRAPPEYSI
jgi:tripartite-type tricarboxylate transporter receptor subunit TctC